MIFHITETPIDTATARLALCQPQSGGYGTRIISEAKARFDIDAAACMHRIGTLQIGELAVWVGVAAGHRGDAFAACRYIIDRIKETVPIWKDEYYSDGSRAWVLNHHCG